MVSNSRPQKRKLPQGIDRYGEKFRSRVSYAGVQHLLGYYFTIADAKAALSIARSEIARGTFVPPTEKRRMQREEARRAREQAERDQRTVYELKNDWIAWLERRGRKLGTIYTYDRQLESNFLDEIGHRSPANIEAPEIQGWSRSEALQQQIINRQPRLRDITLSAASHRIFHLPEGAV